MCTLQRAAWFSVKIMDCLFFRCALISKRWVDLLLAQQERVVSAASPNRPVLRRHSAQPRLLRRQWTYVSFAVAFSSTGETALFSVFLTQLPAFENYTLVEASDDRHEWSVSCSHPHFLTPRSWTPTSSVAGWRPSRWRTSWTSFHEEMFFSSRKMRRTILLESLFFAFIVSLHLMFRFFQKRLCFLKKQHFLRDWKWSLGVRLSDREKVFLSFDLDWITRDVRNLTFRRWTSRTLLLFLNSSRKLQICYFCFSSYVLCNLCCFLMQCYVILSGQGASVSRHGSSHTSISNALLY